MCVVIHVVIHVVIIIYNYLVIPTKFKYLLSKFLVNLVSYRITLNKNIFYHNYIYQIIYLLKLIKENLFCICNLIL